MNLKNGDKVAVTVTKLNPHGVEVDFNGRPGLILITNLSWNIFGVSSRVDQICTVGEVLEVIVLKSEVTPFSASLKDVFPEENPWNDKELLQIGNVLKRKVVSKTNFGVFIELKKGLRALLPLSPEEAGSYVLGSYVSTKIAKIDREQKKVELTKS